MVAVPQRARSDGEEHPIRASFLRRLARQAVQRPLRVSGRPDLADAMRTELLRYAQDMIDRSVRHLLENAPTRRHVVTAADVAAATH